MKEAGKTGNAEKLRLETIIFEIRFYHNVTIKFFFNLRLVLVKKSDGKKRKEISKYFNKKNKFKLEMK